MMGLMSLKIAITAFSNIRTIAFIGLLLIGTYVG